MLATDSRSIHLDRNILIYLGTFLLSIGGYVLVEVLWNGHNFLTVFAFLAITIIAILLLERKLLGAAFWRYLPTVISAYIILALFIPTLLIYRSPILRTLLDWDDFLILKASSLGLIFIQFLWVFYHIGITLFPVRDKAPVLRILPVSRIYILIFLTLLTNFIAIITGTFGVLQKTDFESTANYSMYIDLGQQLGLFSLIILTYQYTHRKYLIGAIGLLLFLLGIISAQKQAALMPLLTIAITLFFKNGRFPKGAIILAVVGVLFTFAAVSTIREYYFAMKSKGVTSVTEVQEITQKALTQKTYNKAYTTYNLNEHILMRVFYGSAIVKAIQYCDRNDYGVPKNSQLYQVLFSPFYAVIPRFILPGKPEANFGNWFANTVFVGHKVKYSIGITPVGYGYMIHGILGVAAVASILGFFMALLYKGLYRNHLFIYILVFIKTILPADVTWEYFAGNIKLIIVYMIIYKLLSVRWYAK